MQTIPSNIVKDVKYLRGMFTNKMYIGGSFSRNFIIPGYSINDANDIDVFIVSDRFVESWVISKFLEREFIIERNNINMEGYYKIPNQYLFFRLTSKCSGIKYDLMFINEVYSDPCKTLYACTASELSYYYLNVGYEDTGFGNFFTNTSIKKAKTVYANLMASGLVHVDKSIATDAHIEKLKKFVKNYNEKFDSKLELLVK